MTIVDASIEVIKYLHGPHDHYVYWFMDILKCDIHFFKYQLSLGISNAQKLLDLKKLQVLRFKSIKKINYFSSHHNIFKMTQLILPTTNLM